MNFLTPFLLYALPLAALPIIIHLLNQRRYQTVNWGAMQFLLTANKMSRGVARIRSWLILLFRTLAVAGLIFAVSRPLASGWLSSAGGTKADTTILLVDRSPSMAQSDAQGVASKLQSGISKLSDTLALFGSTKWVLIDSASELPKELGNAADLKQAFAADVTSASANLPTLLEAAHTYIKENNCGQTNIWILSDLRENDWNSASSRWHTVRDGFKELPQDITFHLLAYPEKPENNIGVRVTGVRRQPADRGGALALSVQLTSTREEGKNVVPLRFDIEGSTTELTVEWEGPVYEVANYEIAIESDLKKGWGRVSVPADVNQADNDFYFVFADESTKRTAVVCEDPKVAKIFQLASAASPDTKVPNPVDVAGVEDLNTIVWDDLSLLVWQAPMPTGEAADRIASFIEAGGRVLMMPPTTPTSDEFIGFAWTDWNEEKNPLPVDRWRGDSDLLAKTESGVSLPLGEVLVKRYCSLRGEATPLATLAGNKPLLVRLSGKSQGVYFLTTTTRSTDSTLLKEGVVLYAMVQRALADGASSRAQAGSLDAGSVAVEQTIDWQQVAGPERVPSDEYAYFGGVYLNDDRLSALNRTAREDGLAVVEDKTVDSLFEGLRFDRLSDQTGSLDALAKEVWKLFLVGMMVALCAEGLLCLPKPRPEEVRR